MKLFKPYYFLAIVIMSMFFAGINYQSALAQCRDASGGSIPCTPKPDDKKRNTETPIPFFPSATPSPTITTTALPIVVNPTESVQTTGAEWSGSCANSSATVGNDCINKLLGSCYDSGGSAHVDFPEKDGGTATLTCTLPLIGEPTELPLSVNPTAIVRPQDEEYLGQCTKADGDFFECAEQFVCEDGLLVVEVDLYSGNGTTYDFYCIKDEDKPTFPPGGWLPWLTGLGGLLIGLLLPAIQKIREPAHRNADDEESMQLRAKRAEVPASSEDGDGMQLRAKRAEIPNDSNDEGFHRLLGDADGDTPPPPPPKK